MAHHSAPWAERRTGLTWFSCREVGAKSGVFAITSLLGGFLTAQCDILAPLKPMGISGLTGPGFHPSEIHTHVLGMEQIQ